MAIFITDRYFVVDKVTTAIDATVFGVNSVYQLFITSVVGEFHRSVSNNVTKLTIRDFTKSCRVIQKQSLDVIERALNDGLSNIELLLRETDAKGFIGIKSDIISVLKMSYKNQMMLDIEAARSDIFRYSLVVARQTDAGVSQTSALIAANKSVKFSFIDRAGKKWNSVRYISTVTRHQIIGGIYFSFIIGAESIGASELILSNDEIINIIDTDRYSHPNSKLIPIQVVRW